MIRLDAPDGRSLDRGGALLRKRWATDGPFAETKEGLGGPILGDARDGSVIDVATRISMAWLGMIEVWPMMASEARDAGCRPGRGRASAGHTARGYQRTCPVCGVPLVAAGSVLFQGDSLVHARCWQADAGR